MTIPPGLIITAILVVNNLRDLENDRKAGKHTLAVILGERATKMQYLICMIAAYLVLPLAASMGVIPWLSLLAWLSLPLAIRTARLCLPKRDARSMPHWQGRVRRRCYSVILFWIGLFFK